MNRCATCKHWVKWTPKDVWYEESGGYCRNEDKIVEGWFAHDKMPDDALVYPYQEGGWFWTGPNFGCVHHKEDAP